MKLLLLITLALLSVQSPSQAEVSCDQLSQTVCKYDENAAHRDRLKEIIRDESARYVGTLHHKLFNDYRDFNIYFNQNARSNTKEVAMLLAQYHACINAMSIDLYNGKIPLASSSCSFVKDLNKIRDTLQARLESSRLNQDFMLIKKQSQNFFFNESIIQYLNLLKFQEVRSNFQSYFDSAVLVSPFKAYFKLSDLGFMSSCGIDGMAYNAFNSLDAERSSLEQAQQDQTPKQYTFKTTVTYCPGFILSMLNVKRDTSLYALPSDRLDDQRHLNLNSFVFTQAPENGKLVIYHELAHCVTTYHYVIGYKDPIGQDVLSCMDQKFKNAFRYEDKTSQSSTVTTKLKQMIFPPKSTRLFMDEVLADHLGAQLLAQDINQFKTQELREDFLKKNLKPFCGFGKNNEPLYDSSKQGALHPSSALRLKLISRVPALRSSLSCATLPSAQRCDYLDSISKFKDQF